MLWLLYIAAVHISASSASEGDDAYCENGNITKNDVNGLLLLINNKRLLLASGMQVKGHLFDSNDGNLVWTKLPPAKNMPKMTYDCKLEQNASQALTDLKCRWPYSEEEQPANGYILSATDFEDYQLIDFWKDLIQIDMYGYSSLIITTQSVIYTEDERLRTYANLMRADATRIACAYNTCGYLCITNQKNIQNGDIIYETGTAKAECDSLFSNDDLNVTSTEVFSGSNFSVGSYCDNGILSKNDVYQVLFLINDKRAILAGGLQVNGGFLGYFDFKEWNPEELPPAKNMSKMAYDCALEQNASNALRELDCNSMPEGDTERFSGFLLEDYTMFDVPHVLWSMLISIDTLGYESFTTTQSLKYSGSDDFVRGYFNLMRADASRIGCASKKCPRKYRCLCVTNQKPISAGDEIYEIRTDGDVDTECDLPWTSKITSTTVFPNTSTSEPQYTTESSQYTTASSQHTASPEYTTTSTKKAKSTIQCVTKTTKTPCATYPPHVKSERRARAADFREALSGKSKKHMTQKARKTQASGRFQNAFEEKPLR